MNRLDMSRGLDDDANIYDVAFTDALDVVRFAETSTLLAGRDSCESWHLDRQGNFVCGTNGTPSDSLALWAADPQRLVHTFLEFRATGTCTPNWVIVDERADATGPGEGDVEQFLRLRRQLDVAGVTLMDCVIFDGASRWWSLCQLLTGSTAWGVAELPDGTPNRLRPIVSL